MDVLTFHPGHLTVSWSSSGYGCLLAAKWRGAGMNFLREWIGCDAGGILLGGNKGHDAQDDMQ